MMEDGRRSNGERSLRERRYRRVFGEHHQTKRLFTPEIKKFLKGWLIRRRKNPYPSRSEKTDLALKTGLTYIQICNWFANWRRKLKKSSHDLGTEDTWSWLITSYNQQARGNVELISIGSEDSMWGNFAGNVTPKIKTSYKLSPDKSLEATSSPAACDWAPPSPADTQESWGEEKAQSAALLKWLESAAHFRPRQVRWGPPPLSRKSTKVNSKELAAAEALTFLRQGTMC